MSMEQTGLHTYACVFGPDQGITFGSIVCIYEVRLDREYRPLGASDAYLVTCTMRAIVPNGSVPSIRPGSIAGYLGYPALLSNGIALVPGGKGIGITTRLRNYQPRTLNASVTTDTSENASSGSTITRQHSTGTANSQTSTFDYSLGSFSGSSSSTKEQSSSTSDALARQQADEHGEGDSMTIKDWAASVSLGTDCASLQWIWSQEYPWDTLQFRNEDSNGNIVLPAFVKQRLFDGTLVYPPSQLSQFGIDLTAKASWRVEYEGDAPMVAVQHTVDYVTASHRLEGAGFVANMNCPLPEPLQLTSSPIDMEMAALDAVGGGTRRTVAVVGFLADRFRVPPAAGAMFSIRSRGNDLLVRGSGFAKAMTADVTSGQATATIVFKVADERSYRLYLKHWVSDNSGCELTFTMPDGSSLVKVVDAKESEGGQENLLRIDLRDNRYTSSNYHNYLVLGTNSIAVTIKAVNPAAGPCLYTLSAVAVA